MKNKITINTTSFNTTLFFRNTADPQGGGLTGINFQTSGLQAGYYRTGDNSATQFSLASGILGSFVASGLIEINSGIMPGAYDFGVPNTVLTISGASKLMFFGAANMAPCLVEIEIDTLNYKQTAGNSVWGDNPGNYLGQNTFGSGINKLTQDIYYADIKVVNGSPVPNNEYGVFWFKNSFGLGSGSITNPALSVFNAVNGIALISNAVMSYSSATLGALSYIEPTNRMASGIPYEVRVSGLIDGVVQNWRGIKGFDFM